MLRELFGNRNEGSRPRTPDHDSTLELILQSEVVKPGRFSLIPSAEGVRRGYRRRQVAKAVGGVASEELEPESADFIVEGGEGMAIFLDPEEMDKLAERASEI